MELLGSSQSTFSDMVSELGLSGGMRSDAEYTLLAPFNSVFSGESYTPHYTACTSLFSTQVAMSIFKKCFRESMQSLNVICGKSSRYASHVLRNN